MSLSVEYLGTPVLHGYIRDSYVSSVVRIGLRKVKDIEVFVKYVIEYFISTLNVFLRSLLFEAVEEPSFFFFVIRVALRSFGLTSSPSR